MDIDGSDRLDFLEFLTAAINYKDFLTRDMIEKLFRYMTQSPDGVKLTRQHLIDLLPTNCNPDGQLRTRMKGPLFEKNECFYLKYKEVKDRFDEIMQEVIGKN